jgi:hypothetical protein
MEHPNLEGLSLQDGEEGFEFDDKEDEQVDLRWCLVGRFICERTIHFNSMKVRMADLSYFILPILLIWRQFLMEVRGLLTTTCLF